MLKRKPFNITKGNLPVLMMTLQDILDVYPDSHWQVIIKERNSDRSIEQNARLWDLYTSIGTYLGYSAEETHQLMGYKFLLEEKNIGRERITRVKSTTKLSVKEMGEYMMKVESWASQMGWSYE